MYAIACGTFTKLKFWLEFKKYRFLITPDDINDDCLLQILELLTLKQLSAVQRVSMRWQQLTERVIANREKVVLYDMVGDNHENWGTGNKRRVHKFDKNLVMVSAFERYLDRCRKSKPSLPTCLEMRIIRSTRNCFHFCFGICQEMHA